MWLRANLKVRPAGFALAAIFLALALSLSRAHAAVVSLAGGYNGTGKASAMAMILDQDEDRIYGRIVDGKNNVFQVSGRVNGRAVQGTLYNQAISANFQIELKPSGLKFVIIPLVDGKPNLGAMKQISFERGRVSHPSLADYRAPAPRQGEMIDLLAFLENYRSWDKAAVVAGFKGLPEKDRAEVRKYDHVQADLMNRLCRGGADAGEIASISKGQGADCVRFIAFFDSADEAGVLRTFYDKVEIQRAALYTKIACERNVYAGSRCAEAQLAPPKAWLTAARILGDLTEARSRAPSIGPTPTFTAPRLTLPRLEPTSASGPPARTLPMPPPQVPLQQKETKTSTAAINTPALPSRPLKASGSGFVAFFQSKPADAAAPAAGSNSGTDDLFAALDFTLKPSTAHEQAKLLTPKPSRAEGFLNRVREKMRARPERAKGVGAQTKGVGVSGAVGKVPMPRPRPAS